jgi:zinc protease
MTGRDKIMQKLRLFRALTGLTLALGWTPVQAQTVPTAPTAPSQLRFAPTVYGITDGRTASGLRLVHLQIPDEKDQSFQMFWRDREVQHNPAKAGLLTLAPTLLTLGGAGALEGGAVEEELNDLGGFFGFSRGRSVAMAEIFAPRGQIDAVAGLFSTVLNNPKLSPVVLTRRKRFLANARKVSREKADNFASELMQVITIGDHPIARTINYDPPSTITDVSVADVDAWRKSVLRRSTLTVVAAGPMTRAEAAELVDKTFAGLPEGGSELDTIPFTPRSLAKTIVIERKVEQSIILMGGPVRWRSGGPDGIARNLAMSVLGGGSSSRLFTEVREKLGAAYGASSSISSILGQNNLFAMQASVANDKVNEARAAMLSEYQKFRVSGVTAAEIDPLKRRMANGFPDTMRKANSAASVIRTSLINDLNYDAANAVVQNINWQTPERINALISERLPEKLTTILIVPSAKGIEADCIIATMEDLPRCFAP